MKDNNQLPELGFLRLKQILQFITVGETTWRVGVKEGYFPKPIKMADRVNLWRVEDIRDLITSYSNQPEHDEKRSQSYTNKVNSEKPYEQLELY